VVSGLYALHQHTGIYRETKDLDVMLEPGHVVEAARVLKKAGFGPMVAAWAGECFVLAVIGQSLLPARFGAALAIAVLAKIVVLLVALAIVAILFTVFFAGVVAIH